MERLKQATDARLADAGGERQRVWPCISGRGEEEIRLECRLEEDLHVISRPVTMLGLRRRNRVDAL